MNNYGSSILGERAKKRINQTSLSRQIGIHIHTLTDIENGRIGIDEPTYKRIMDAISQIGSDSAN